MPLILWDDDRVCLHNGISVPTRKGKREVRVVLNEETVRLLKGIAGVTERSVSNLIQEAVDKLLSEENMQNLIEHHRLDEEVDSL